MSMFKQVAQDQFKVLLFAFVLGNAFHAFPANPPEDSACGSDFYSRLLTTHYFLLFLVFASAMLLLAVRVAINIAEADAIAAARAARGRDFDAHHEAAIMGLASVPARWKRRFLRALLRLAVRLSTVACYLAIVAFEDGYHYRTGCHAHAPFRAGWPFRVLMCLMTGVCAVSDWVAREKN